MKLWHLLFLLHSSFLLTTLTVRVQDQFTFQMLQDVIPDPSSDTSSSQSQTENHILTNTDICNNLLEYLLVFGETSTSKYKTCPDKYSLLGNSNSLVQKDQPQCLLSLSQIFCTYEIVTDPVRPHPDDLRYFITQTISRCVRSQEWPSSINTYICPSLDYDTKIVQNKEDFCANLQAMHQRDATMAQADQNILSSYYKTYQFVGKESVKECHEIVKLYNFCIEISIYLGLDTRKCFTNQFILYEEGGQLQEYNTKDQDTCKNFILPFFGYITNQEDILQPSNTFGFCDSINVRIVDQLQAKQIEIKQDIIGITANKTNDEASVAVLTNLNASPPQITQTIDEIQTLWRRIYNYLTNNEQLEVTNVTKVEKENLDLFTQTVADWVMTSRSSLEYLKTLPINETFLKNTDLLTNNFEKIRLLGTHLTDYGKFLTETFAKTVTDNTEVNMVDNQDIINVKCADLKATGGLLDEAHTNLKNFLVSFEKRMTNEIQTNQETLDAKQKTLSDLTERLQALQEQETISYSHIP